MRILPSFTALAPFLILLGSCVGPAAQRPVAQPAPAPARPAPAAPAPVPQAQPSPVAKEWQYRPVAPGSWRYRAEAAGSSAAFGSGVADAQLTLRCDRASRRVSLARAGGMAGAGAGTGQGALIVRTSYGAASWPATVSAGAAGQLVAFRAASDTGLDQLAYSRGKIAVEAAGQPMLIVPAWAEISRVIEDCRG
ncbi:hypothetical protein HHL08_12820 [Sphingobium sp. AR-3-1]|uniref:Lipoprotein n=1 Tax=Sphingobium psychrophilum TaxID=2728834 RepID=A0A7X9ZSX4_9SPHN|nr:hypothetical protein [Sphingobium psychrophilum]NML11017.1 hypothetical protein [Sphingobium psychrophilum]